MTTTNESSKPLGVASTEGLGLVKRLRLRASYFEAIGKDEHAAEVVAAADEIERLEFAERYALNLADAALSLWPRDCRLCANYTTASGGCVSAIRCVDSDQYKATPSRQFWEAQPIEPAPF